MMEKKNFFFTVQLLRSKNDFSGGKAPEKINLGNNCHPNSQSQGSVEKANLDIENMIATWLVDNKSTKWTEDWLFVQFMKNRAYYSGIQQSPYKAMFAFEPRVGLLTTGLPSDMISIILEENDLSKVLNSIRN